MAGKVSTKDKRSSQYLLISPAEGEGQNKAWAHQEHKGGSPEGGTSKNKFDAMGRRRCPARLILKLILCARAGLGYRQLRVCRTGRAASQPALPHQIFLNISIVENILKQALTTALFYGLPPEETSKNQADTDCVCSAEQKLGDSFPSVPDHPLRSFYL